MAGILFATRARRERDQRLPVTEIRLIRLCIEKLIPTNFIRVYNKLVIGDRPFGVRPLLGSPPYDKNTLTIR